MAITIERITEGQVDAAKQVIREVCFEFFGQDPADSADMENVSSCYAEPSGIFLVLLDEGRVVGTGAIRQLESQICELKRMWFLPAYRGRGYGRQMADSLLDFARSAGYKRVRLDTDPILVGARKLYHRLGFQPIERYNDGPCAVFMEKEL